MYKLEIDEGERLLLVDALRLMELYHQGLPYILLSLKHRLIDLKEEQEYELDTKSV